MQCTLPGKEDHCYIHRVSSGSEVLSKDLAEIKELAMETFRGRLFQVKRIIATKALGGGRSIPGML